VLNIAIPYPENNKSIITKMMILTSKKYVFGDSLENMKLAI
jgi:hypothetical protein